MRERMIRDRAGQWHKQPYVVPALPELRPFQIAGAHWMQERESSLLGDDMGLGKTAQVIETINSLPKDARILIICPAGLRLNWLRELAQFLRFERRAAISKRYIPPHLPIVIVSLDTLSKFEVQIRRLDWDLIALDEAHLIRNSRTIRANQILGNESTAPLRAGRKIAMTGTPMPNRPMEVWTILRFLGLEMTRQEFGQRFCGGGDFKGSSNPEELRALLGKFMLRRTKRQVMKELPEKTRQIVRIAPAGAARACILAEGRWQKQVGQVEKFKGGVKLTELTKLRQATALAKLSMPIVQDIIREAVECRNKLVIFAVHHDTVEAAAAIVRSAGAFAVKYHGGMTTDDRQKAVDYFQKTDKRTAFIATIGAGGVGITLTAASHVLFIEEDFTPGNTEQAEDRCHRYGQRNAVMVQHIVLDGSYDERQLAIQVEKQGVISAVL